MTFDLLHSDCIEAMRTMPENSVDAIVTDPPYGLEFMGKEWDRLGDIGKISHAGPADVAGGERGQYGKIHYSGSSNAKCLNCGKWRWDYPQRKCSCDSPSFPNEKAYQARIMQSWHHAWALEALRVLKPGGHLLAFGGTRTYHRLTCALEDAGFEIRDCCAWLYATGFPKSLDISKAIDKAAGAEREHVLSKWADQYPNGPKGSSCQFSQKGTASTRVGVPMDSLPATDAARQWSGWGTALKPAFEPIVLARKPLSEKNVAANVLRWGTGGINVDAGRIPTDEKWEGRELPNAQDGVTWGGVLNSSSSSSHGLGRWPANVAFDEEAAKLLDEQSESEMHGAGAARSGSDNPRETGPNDWQGPDTTNTGAMHRFGDAGGASRFFYVAKADRAERNAGLEGMEARFAPTMGNGIGGKEHDPITATPKRNHHPTVKPVALMSWLVKLVTPPGGTVLDPFMGSGSTGIAATRQGFQFIGIEREAEYLAIARRRIEEDAPLFNRDTEPKPETGPSHEQLRIMNESTAEL